MFVIVEGGEEGKQCLFIQIKEDFVSSTQEMHDHLVKVILGMGNQVCVVRIIINAI
jgi:hypothetical protein